MCIRDSSETTSGILNDIEAVGAVVKAAGRTFIVDAMSSFGGVDIPVSEYGIDFLISSANKCIQGVPGFSFILARRSLLEKSAGQARSLSLDLYEQWKTMEKDGKWRFTSPTHVVLAFAKAMEELSLIHILVWKIRLSPAATCVPSCCISACRVCFTKTVTCRKS